jgi:hypothetical protein
MEQRIADRPAPEKKALTRSRAVRSSSPNNPLDRFQQIKRTQGLDAAAEYIRERQEKA